MMMMKKKKKKKKKIIFTKKNNRNISSAAKNRAVSQNKNKINIMTMKILIQEKDLNL